MYLYFTPFYSWATSHCVVFCLSIHLWVNMWVVCTFWLVWVEPLQTFVYKILFEHLFWILQVQTGAELLGYGAIPCLTYWRAVKLFSVVVPFTISTNSVYVFHFLYILTDAHEFPFGGLYLFYWLWKWYLTVVLIFFALMTNDTEHLSYAWWTFVYLLWRKVYSKPSFIKRIELCVFLLL